MCIRIYILNLKKKKEKKEKKDKKTKKAKETKKKKRTFVEMMTSFANFLCVLITYLVELWYSPGYSYEFNVVCMQREKSQYLLHYNNIWTAHFQEQK